MFLLGKKYGPIIIITQSFEFHFLWISTEKVLWRQLIRCWFIHTFTGSLFFTWTSLIKRDYQYNTDMMDWRCQNEVLWKLIISFDLFKSILQALLFFCLFLKWKQHIHCSSSNPNNCDENCGLRFSFSGSIQKSRLKYTWCTDFYKVLNMIFLLAMTAIFSILSLDLNGSNR